MNNAIKGGLGGGEPFGNGIGYLRTSNPNYSSQILDNGNQMN